MLLTGRSDPFGDRKVAPRPPRRSPRARWTFTRFASNFRPPPSTPTSITRQSLPCRSQPPTPWERRLRTPCATACTGSGAGPRSARPFDAQRPACWAAAPTRSPSPRTPRRACPPSPTGWTGTPATSSSGSKPISRPTMSPGALLASGEACGSGAWNSGTAVSNSRTWTKRARERDWPP